MIIYDLTCVHNHLFEGWFGSVSNFEKQLADKSIACPVCGTQHIQKLPKASRTSNASREVLESNEIILKSGAKLSSQEIFSQLIKYVIHNVDGTVISFSDDVFKAGNPESGVYYIRGETSAEDITEMLGEGVDASALDLKLAGKLH